MRLTLSQSSIIISFVIGIILSFLKIQGCIDWNWFYITAAFWWPVVVYALVLSFAFVVVLLCFMSVIVGAVFGGVSEGFKCTVDSIRRNKRD